MLVVTGNGYLNGFIGDRDADTTWLDEKVQGWAQLARTIKVVACKYPQSAYSGLKKSLN